MSDDRSAMEAQFQAAREEAERRFRDYQRQIAAELARNVGEAFPIPAGESGDSKGRSVSQPVSSGRATREAGKNPAGQVRPGHTPEGNPGMLSPGFPLDQAPVADLHRLEQADSHVRHSIVETCFYNLRLYSALLPERQAKPGFREKLQANLDHLPAIRDELAGYFRLQVGGLPLAAYVPDQERAVREELAELARLADGLTAAWEEASARGTPRRGSHTGAGAADPGAVPWLNAVQPGLPGASTFAEAVPGRIDRVMAALAEITARLRAVKVDLVRVLEDVVALHRERLSAEGISVRFTNKNGQEAPIFGRRRDLLSAFGELLKNAARHGLADLPPGRPRVIGIVLRQVTTGQQTYQVDVADSGRGIPDQVRRHLGVRGVTTGGTGEGFALVRRIVETDHLGSVAVLSRQGTGTLVRVHLPRNLALERSARPDPQGSADFAD